MRYYGRNEHGDIKIYYTIPSRARDYERGRRRSCDAL